MDAARTEPTDAAGIATDLMNSAVDGMARGAEAQKNASAEAIAGFAKAIRQTADGLDAQSPQIARFVRTSAEAADRFSQDLRTRDVADLLKATTQFARQRPYLFLGLGVAVGAILARTMAAQR